MKESLLDEYLNLLGFAKLPYFLRRYLQIPCLVRLKNIGYFCGMDYASKDIYDFKEKITRYDHSLSVALLTWRFTKNKKATLAALFHDVATPCFAHVIDYMNKDYAQQESTEEYTKEVLGKDEQLLKLLKKDGITLEDISDFKQYSIVDNDRPRLCADRLDGIILTGIAWTKTLNRQDIIEIVNDIDVYKNEFGELELGFKTLKVAKKALDTSNQIDIYCHTNEDNYMMEFLAHITKMAIDNELITYESLYYLDESLLIKCLEECKIAEIKEAFQQFRTIMKDDIPPIKLENVKKRDLKPLVGGLRLK